MGEYKIGDGKHYCPANDFDCPYWVDCYDDANAKNCALEDAPTACDEFFGLEEDDE